MHQHRSWFIVAMIALAGAIAIQVAAQFAASAAMSAAATGAHSNDASVADTLTLLGMVLAGVGVVLWVASAVKHQVPTHAAPFALLVLYAFFFLIMV
ncbi:MAG: hypothetical protein ACKVT0_15490 [Planctomycetaceae bacterium]